MHGSTFIQMVAIFMTSTSSTQYMMEKNCRQEESQKLQKIRAHVLKICRIHNKARHVNVLTGASLKFCLVGYSKSGSQSVASICQSI